MAKQPEVRYMERICRSWGIAPETYDALWGEWFNMFSGSTGWHSKPAAEIELRLPCLHFVGFRGDEFERAIDVFGEPDFVHPLWDVRAQQEVAENDKVVFANGCELKPPTTWSFNDSERW